MTHAYRQALAVIICLFYFSTGAAYGATIKIDATALTPQIFLLDYKAPWFSTQSVDSHELLPGKHLFVTSHNTAGRQPTAFTVTQEGTVDYAPEYESFMGGRGTDTLVLKGVTIRIDATALSYQVINIFGWKSPTQVIALTVMPGRHEFIAPSDVAGYNYFYFQVSSNGAVDYDQAWDEIVGGRGTSTLVLKGRRITVNARALSGASIDVSGSGWRDTRDALNLTLMPGRHSINVPAAAYNYAFFTLQLEDGTIDYDSDMDHVLAGRGTATLLVRGTIVFVDARSIQDTSIVVDSSAWMPTSHILPLVLMPGKHSIQRVTASGGRSLSYFDVMNDGKVNYDPNADILFEGRNTNTLRLRQ